MIPAAAGGQAELRPASEGRRTGPVHGRSGLTAGIGERVVVEPRAIVPLRAPDSARGRGERGGPERGPGTDLGGEELAIDAETVADLPTVDDPHGLPDPPAAGEGQGATSKIVRIRRAPLRRIASGASAAGCGIGESIRSAGRSRALREPCWQAVLSTYQHVPWVDTASTESNQETPVPLRRSCLADHQRSNQVRVIRIEDCPDGPLDPVSAGHLLQVLQRLLQAQLPLLAASARFPSHYSTSLGRGGTKGTSKALTIQGRSNPFFRLHQAI